MNSNPSRYPAQPDTIPRVGSPVAVVLTRIAILTGIALLLVGGPLAALRGLWRPVRIQGGSMADSLLGDHLELRCGDCGITIRCGAEHLADERRVVCPNCGFADNIPRADERRRGDRVWIDRSARTRSPRRWDTVALASADDPLRLEVKRIVGLPGELVQLQNGDVWVNGRPAAKTLAQFRQLAIRVHDDRYRPADPTLPRRWRGVDPGEDGATPGWQPTADGYRHLPTPPGGARRHATAGRWQWLSYQQWPCMPNPFPPRGRTQSGAVLDHYGYNQALSRGTLHAVEDLRLSFRLRQCGAGQLGMRLSAAGHQYEVHWSPQIGSVRLLQDGVQVRSTRTSVRGRSRPALVEWAHWDRQVGLAIDGHLVVLYRTEDKAGHEAAGTAASERPAAGTNSNLAGGTLPPNTLQIGATSDTAAEIDQVAVDRDLVYLDRLGTQRTWSPARRLGRNEYLVLGDNVPVSRDSRHWRSPFLRRGAILGTVLGSRSAAKQVAKTTPPGGLVLPEQPFQAGHN